MQLILSATEGENYPGRLPRLTLILACGVLVCQRIGDAPSAPDGTYTCLALTGAEQPEARDESQAVEDQQRAAGDRQPKAEKGGEKPAAGRADETTRKRWWALINEAPYDLVQLKGRKDPIAVRPSLPKPFMPADHPRQRRFRLAYRRAAGRTTLVRVADIKWVKHFEHVLEDAAREALRLAEYDWAFDLTARLLQYNPNWPTARRLLVEVNIARAQAELERDPPRYQEALALCMELAGEHAEDLAVRSLFKRVVVSSVRDAIEKEDYGAAWDAIRSFRRHYAADEELFQLERKLVDTAEELAKQAQFAMHGDLEQQRRAAVLLAKVRRIWPEYPGIDKLIRQARRNYPVLHIGVFELPGTFNPLYADTLVEHQACQLLLDRLADYDLSGRHLARGPLVAKWTRGALGLRHEIELYRDLEWSDGARVTAYDVQSSIRLWMDRRIRNYDPERSRFLGAVKVLDPFRLELELKLPYPRPYDLLAVQVLPRHKLNELSRREGRFGQAPVGTGPFRLGGKEADRTIRFVANTRYRGVRHGQPYLKEIQFHRYVNAGTAARDLELGRIHLLTQLDPLQVIRFSKLPGRLVVRRYLGNSVWMLAINHRRRVFNDLRLRRAILLAIDRQEMLKHFYHAGPGGLAHRVITGPFPDHSPAYNHRVPVVRQNMPLASRLIKELKSERLLPDRPLTLKYSMRDPVVEKVASQIRKDLKRVGLTVQTEAKIPSDLHREVVLEHEYDLVYWRYDHRNMLYNISSLFDPAAMEPGGTNFMGYSDRRLEILFGELRAEQRPLEIWRIQQKIHAVIAEQLPFIPLWQLDNYIAHSTSLVYRYGPSSGARVSLARLPIHPLYLFADVGGWYLEQ